MLKKPSSRKYSYLGNVTENQAAQVLSSVLAEVPFLRVKRIIHEKEVSANGPHADLWVDLLVNGRPERLLVEVKGSGQPRFAREAANALFRLRHLDPKVYLIFMAPYISPESAEIITAGGFGFIDFSGNCFLSFKRVFIKKENQPNQSRIRRELRKLYSPKAERVLRVLLMNPKRHWRIEELADEAQVSPAHVYNVKERLKDREWAATAKAGLTLSQPEALLREWADNYAFKRHQRFDFFSLKESKDIEKELANFCSSHELRYALTGFSAAERLASYARHLQVAAYINSGPEQIANVLGLKKVPSGSNVILLLPYDEGVFYQPAFADGQESVSPIQAFLDLKHLGGRGADAAEFLFSEVIRKTW